MVYGFDYIILISLLVNTRCAPFYFSDYRIFHLYGFPNCDSCLYEYICFAFVKAKNQ